MANVVTYAGVAIISNLVSGIGGAIAKYIGWGTGSGTSARSDTALFTEDYSTTNDGTHNLRGTGTVSRVTTSQTNDTVQVVGTLTQPHSGGATITNVGLFDTNGQAADLVTAPSGGNLLVKSDFTGIALSQNDSIQFTLQLQFT